jgi:hypothetical protein
VLVVSDWLVSKQERRYVEDLIARDRAEKATLTCLSTREQEELAKANIADDDDEAFLHHYRRMRLQQVQQQVHHHTQHGRVFGSVQHVTAPRFLHAVDTEHSDVFIVTLLYDKHDAAGIRAVYCIKDLAKRLPNIKFLKAIAHELKPEWDPVALPSLLVYRAGQLYTSFIRIQHELGDNFSSFTVAQLLASYVLIQLNRESRSMANTTDVHVCSKNIAPHATWKEQILSQQEIVRRLRCDYDSDSDQEE